MQPSANLVDFIKEAEGFMPHAYLDPKGNTRHLYSTGYGHQIQPNERPLITKILTKPEATLMLDSDLRQYVDATNKALKRPVTQGQFDALVDLAYNAGPGRMKPVAETWNSTGSIADTVKHLKEYHFETISPNVHRINYDLVKRRAHEANWFEGTTNPTISRAAVIVQKKNTGLSPWRRLALYG